MGLFNLLFGRKNAVDLQKLISEGAYLVDVRTPSEFSNNHLKNSVNIPLNMIKGQLSKFKGKKNIIVYCQSGNRSSQAKSILEKNAITNVVDGGSISNVKRYLK